MRRFSLRTLLIGVTLFAVALWAIPAAIEWRRQQRIEELISEDVRRTIDKFANKSGASQPIQTFARDSVFDQYHLSTRRFVTDPKDFETIPPEDLQRPGLVYVRPPGEWVKTPEEAIQLLKKHL